MRATGVAGLLALAAAAATAGACFIGGPAGAATATLAPVADAYVTAAAPHANFGGASSFQVGGGAHAVAYLRFRVAVPSGTSVTRATLRLVVASPSSGGFTVNRVTSATWNERTIDYANAPGVGAAVASSPGPPSGASQVTVDVTPLVARSGLVSLAIRGTRGSRLAFRSRESRAGRPGLVVASSAATTGTAPMRTGPCGTTTAPPAAVDHVIWIWMENKPFDAVVGSPAAPFENQLAAACGLATNYHGVAHPSLPNYIAATSGSTQGIGDDEPPAAHPLDVPSIYSQVKAAGKTWRDYEESAPGNCPLVASGNYAVRHDPAAYYTGIRGDCATWDVPLGTPAAGNLAGDLAAGTLPAFALVTPDLCSDTHDCLVASGDAWLQAWVTKIVASPTYLAGRTVVFITWDEDDGSGANHVPLIAVSPPIAPGTQAGAVFDHYSLLRTTEQLLGLSPYLGAAAGASSMAAAFGLA